MKQVQDADLRLMRIFVTIVQCGSFSAAQSVLNIGQSAISEHMTRLETRLGVRLCERGRGGFRLTEPGEEVYASAQRLLMSVETFRHETSSLTALHGELRLGIIDNTITNSESILIPALRRFHNHAKGVRIRIETRSPHELEQRVLDGRLHAAISPFPVQIQGITYEQLFDELHHLYCGQGHPLYDKTDISIEDIQESLIITHSYEHAADLKALNAEVAAAIIDNVEAEAMLILTGHYIGLLPTHYATSWEESGEFKVLLPDNFNYSSPFFLITKSGGHQSAVLSTFLEDFRGSTT